MNRDVRDVKNQDRICKNYSDEFLKKYCGHFSYRNTEKVQLDARDF